MGLDMYLYRREYVSGWDHTFEGDKPGAQDLYKSICDYFDAERCEGSPHAYVDICVAYWRKANAIHGWFVRELANGVDECQSILVTRENLVTLREKADAMLRVPANFRANVAEKSGLPTTGGFFFGSYDYDEWYMEDMKNTVSQLDKILESVPADRWTDFIYRASW